jgi:hypothetical protein
MKCSFQVKSGEQGESGSDVYVAFNNFAGEYSLKTGEMTQIIHQHRYPIYSS